MSRQRLLVAKNLLKRSIIIELYVGRQKRKMEDNDSSKFRTPHRYHLLNNFRKHQLGFPIFLSKLLCDIKITFNIEQSKEMKSFLLYLHYFSLSVSILECWYWPFQRSKVIDIWQKRIRITCGAKPWSLATVSRSVD